MDLLLGRVRDVDILVSPAWRRAEPNRAVLACRRLCSILLLFQEVGETARK